MSSSYINKSVKGKSIINNVDIVGELNTEHITNQSGSNYDIGSSSSHFRTLYVDNINISSANLQGSAPITLNQNGIGLNYNTTQFAISNGALNLATTNTTSTVDLNTNYPIYLTEGSISLNAAAPFINNNSNQLALDLQKTIDLNGFTVNKIFVNNSGKLDYNLSALIYPGNGISKLTYADYASDYLLDYIPGSENLPDIVYLKTAIDTEVLDFKNNNISIKSLGQSRIPFYNAFKLTSDSTFLYDDASNELSVDRIILNDIVDHTSDNNRAATKSYVDNLNTYQSDRPLYYTQADSDSTRIWDIQLNSTYLSVDTGGSLITTLKGFDGGCISVSPDNELTLTYNNKHFGETTAGSLYSKLSGTTSGCIGLTPDYELELNYNTSQFTISNGSLQSTLTNLSGGCVLIDPSNRIYLDINTTDFNITGGKLQSSLATYSGGALSLANNVLRLNLNTNDFTVTGGNLQLNLSTSSTSAVLLNATNQITFGYNDKHFSVVANKLKSDLTGTGAIIVSDSGAKLDVSVAVDTTYLSVTTNKITFATGIVTKINKIDTIETELNTTKTKVTTAEGKITSLEGRMTTNEAKDTTQDGQITALQSQVTSVQTQVGIVQGQVTTLTTVTIATDAVVVGHTALLAAHTAQLTSLQGQVTIAGTNLATLNTIVATNVAATAVLVASDIIHTADLNGLHGYIDNNINPNIANIRDDVNDLVPRVNTLESSSDNHHQRLLILEETNGNTITNLTVGTLNLIDNYSQSSNETFEIDYPFIRGGRFNIETNGNVNIPIKLNATNGNIQNLNLTGNFSQNSNETFEIDYPFIKGGRFNVQTDGNVNIPIKLNATNGNIQNLTVGNLVLTNLTVSNISNSQITSLSNNNLVLAGEITSSNERISTIESIIGGNLININSINLINATITNLIASSGNLININSTNGNLINATITNLIASSGNLININSTNGNLINATITNLIASSGNLININSTNGNLINATITNLITSSYNSTNGNLINATITNLIASSGNLININSTNSNLINSTITNLINTNISSINLNSSNGSFINNTITNLLTTNISSSTLNTSNGSLINSTITNLINTNISSINFNSSNGNFTNLTVGNMVTNNVSIGTLSATNGVFTNLSVGNLITNIVTNISSVTATLTSATITNLQTTNITGNNGVFTNLSVGNLITPNISSANATLTSATITDLITTNIISDTLSLNKLNINNSNGSISHFNYLGTSINYIRGETIIDAKVNINSSLIVSGSITTASLLATSSISTGQLQVSNISSSTLNVSGSTTIGTLRFNSGFTSQLQTTSLTTTSLLATGNVNVLSNVNGPPTNLIIKNTNSGSSAYTIMGIHNNNDSGLFLFLNSSTRSVDGGTNTATIRNDIGQLRLQNGSSQSTITLNGTTTTISGSLIINSNTNANGGTTSGALVVTGGIGSSGLSYFSQLNVNNGGSSNNLGMGLRWNNSSGEGESIISWGTGQGGNPRLSFQSTPNGSSYTEQVYINTTGMYTKDIYARRGDSTGAIYFGDQNQFLYYNGISFEFSKSLVLNTSSLSASSSIFLNSSKAIVSRPGFSYQLWNAFANTGIPNNSWTVLNFLTKISGGGQGELVQYNGSSARFRNDNGANMLYMCSFTSRPVGTGIDNWAMRIECGGVTMAQTELSSGRNEINISATGIIGPGQDLQFICNQYTGFGQNAEGIRVNITTYPIL